MKNLWIWTVNQSHISLKKDEDSGSALYFALMPTFLSDDEFNEKYQELKQHRDDGFPDLPKAAETAAVLCDNVYRRIRYGDSLPIGNIKVDTPANGVLQRLTPLNIQKGVYAPTEIIQGTFQVLKRWTSLYCFRRFNSQRRFCR